MHYMTQNRAQQIFLKCIALDILIIHASMFLPEPILPPQTIIIKRYKIRFTRNVVLTLKLRKINIKVNSKTINVTQHKQM